jgi:integrase
VRGNAPTSRHRAGLPPLHLHGLRHSALSAMAERGVRLAVLSAWAGHASPSFTAAAYLVANTDAINAGGLVLADVLAGEVR